MSLVWDPDVYARFSDERTRPLADLLGRIGADHPDLVVDLGCGNGPATMTLAERWPAARIVGVDNSEQMLEAARALDRDGRVEWVAADLQHWDPDSLGASPDVIVSNAALQWIAGHRALLSPWVDALAPGGWFGLQVPGNWDAPSHALMREAALDHPRRSAILDTLRLPDSDAADDYLQALTAPGRILDVWETTYLHVLDAAGVSENPVLDWVSGTGLRPVMAALTDEGERAAYLASYAAALGEAYPRTDVGVVLPFRRLFAVVHRPALGSGA